MADQSQTKRKRTNKVTKTDADETPSKKKATSDSSAARKAEFEKKFENGLVKLTNIYKQNATQSLQSAKTLERYAGLITKLHVTYNDKHHRYDKELEDAIILHCRQSLIEVELVGFDRNAFNHIKTPFPNVKKVCFRSGELSKFISGFDKWFPNASSLDLIELKILKPADTKYIEKRFPALEHLGVINPRQADEDFDYKYASKKEINSLRKINIFTSVNVNATISMNPQLKSLALKHTNDDRRGYYVDDTDGIKISSDFLTFLNETLPDLEGLSLTVTQLDFGDRAEVHFKNLKRLTMAFESSYTLNNFKFSTDDLEFLSLAGVLDKECAKFVSLNKNVKKLKMSGVWKKPGFDSLLPVLSTLPKLEEIELPMNGGLTAGPIIPILMLPTLTKMVVLKGGASDQQSLSLPNAFEKQFGGTDEWQLKIDENGAIFQKDEATGDA
ncbi:uncharacterized protein LOC119077064 [Bradysia coprophila]|uniref:uncharacterized protein LOC119077064 n=1 Tax=Bradysia coprophila TaxID=38358 RepID=UPI00187DBE74|nr:uncharacterized protein LOC119077064 [Bradysia coprophila]